jgi:hypothetical protein
MKIKSNPIKIIMEGNRRAIDNILLKDFEEL